MRSVAAFGVALLLFAFSASPDDDPEVKKLLTAIAGGILFYKYVEEPLLRSLKKTVPVNKSGQTSSTSLFM